MREQQIAARPLVFVALCLLPMACATTPSAATAHATARATAGSATVAADALAAHRDWWQAYVSGDRARIEAHTDAQAIATFSSGTRLTRDALLSQLPAQAAAAGFSLAWSDESVQHLGGDLVLVTATSTEGAGPSTQVFRISTLIDGVGTTAWRVRHVQTTRVARFAPAVAPSVSGPLADYAGAYRTPRGGMLRMELRDGALWLVEPDGKAIAMTPTGPGLFEPAGQSPLNGILRFVFSRDERGRVAAFSRLTEGRVDVFPRER
jgi:hypothetical protein